MAHFQPIDANASSSDKSPVDEAKLVAGSPETWAVNQFTNAKENFFVGVWGSSAGKWSINYTEDEFFTILEGEAIITEEGGEPQRMVAGDHMTMAAGFKGTWETVGSVKKLYVIYED